MDSERSAGKRPQRLPSSSEDETNQSIPLRNLSMGDGELRGRSLLSVATRPPSGGTYARLDDKSPSRITPVRRATAGSPPSLSGPGRSASEVKEAPNSPIFQGSAEDFQSAMGFAGLHVPDINLSRPPRQRSSSYGSEQYGPSSPLRPQRSSSYGDNDERSPYFQPDSDRVPLTDANYLQPVAGPTSTNGQSRSSFQSISFDHESRLGDNLSNAEAGRGGRPRSQSYGASLTPDGARSRSRSKSPAGLGALSKAAGSIVRAMSQRVVNISGEAEAIEESARREQAHSFEESGPRQSFFPGVQDTAYRPEQSAPPEKVLPQIYDGPRDSWPAPEKPSPFKGYSLGIFSPQSKVRQRLCDLLVYPVTEPAILALIVVQTILLAVDASPSVYTHPRPSTWGGSFNDYALLGLFIIFTIELIIRIIVSGLIINAAEYSSIDRQRGLKAAALDKYRAVFDVNRKSSVRRPQLTDDTVGPGTIVNSFAGIPRAASTVEEAQRMQLARRAFLRHGFNRLDFVAVVSFWIAFVIGTTGIEAGQHVYIFRMLSCLRILRLLALTNGTAVILRSLKKAAPLLVNVSFLIGFFWLLFAIIGIQSFKGSFDRQCVWIDPSDPGNVNNTAYVNQFQFCGGQLNATTGAPEPWMSGSTQSPFTDLTFGAASSKGFLCPRQSFCLQLPAEYLIYNGTVNFDNIAQSLELVFVIMTANTFADLMYYTTDSDYLAAALFYAGGIVIMMLWLLNLLIAVITSSFQIIREESKASAFAADPDKEKIAEDDLSSAPRVSVMKRVYDNSYWFWVFIITCNLFISAFRSATMGETRKFVIDYSELVVTSLLMLEIMIRFAVDWRGFHKVYRNWFDLFLAVTTTILLIPMIKNSGQPYAWLSAFQILRIYRVVMAVKVTRSLIMLVLGNATGIGNLVLFVFLITFLVSLFAVQLFRGELPSQLANGDNIEVTFFTLYNTYLGLYQILSSENWTTLMYNITNVDNVHNTAWIGAVFFIGWFILANFILVNMFIAVIQENFDVSEDEKRMQQVKSFLSKKDSGSSSSQLTLASILRFGRGAQKKDAMDYGPATMEMLLKDAVVRDFLDEEFAQAGLNQSDTPPAEAENHVHPGFAAGLWAKFLKRVWYREPNPFYSDTAFGGPGKDKTARDMAKEAVSATSHRKQAQREYLSRHPTYNNVFFFLTPRNPIRRFCQRIVGPGRGSERFDGVEPYEPAWYGFSALIYFATIAMVLLACVTTPLYQKEYFNDHDFSVYTWFVFADLGFAVVFVLEAVIKVLADGFFWTPNAYYRSTWGLIDGVVVTTLIINVVASFTNDGAISRGVGAFKALRALRLLNVSDSARDTFQSVILVGGWKLLSAAMVSLSLLIPFAIYGVNLFNGQLMSCNDSSITDLSDCTGDWASTPFSSNWTLMAPRVISNPYYDFDDFGSALFILFQIVSQEGWVGVMFDVQGITGRGTQPQPLSRQANAIFFVIFNLMSTVFILTLFISVFMRNYTEQTGVAFLTAEQRSWLELRKLLRQISPSKRPMTNARNKLKEWCYKRATRKNGKWNQMITFVLVVHLVLLMIEYYPEPDGLDVTRDYIFLGFTLFYLANIVVRIYGLSWARFRRSAWDLFALFAVVGTLATTILLLTNITSQVFIQLHKLFLVAIVLLLIPRNEALDQLFKTAAASLTTIGSLLATWFILFLVFAIAMTQTFGLTRFGSNQNDNVNVRTVPKALILLFAMSCGEGWNQIMEDYATIKPPMCTLTNNFFNSDCGSTEWARGLFISWNVLSMYIFTSLFVSLIYESFSYVFQRSSGLAVVNREELRRFKQAWATLDPKGTGYISKEAFPRLLGELSGVFEMRIYSHENSVHSILEDIRPANRTASIASASGASGINLKALNERLARIDPKAVQKSRARYNMFYEEVMVSADVDRGISFTSVLMVLAHYNVISDNKSLRLEEFLRRRARLQRVEEEVRRRVVVGFFDTMYWSRRFKKIKERKKSGFMTTVPQLGPEVFVDDAAEVSKQAASTLSPSWAPQHPMVSSQAGGAESRASFITYGTLDGMPQRDRRGTDASVKQPLSPIDGRGPSPQLSPNRPTPSNFGFEHDLGTSSVASSRRGSAVSAENVLEVLDNSAWGESIRRSFTLKRPPKDRHEAP